MSTYQITLPLFPGKADPWFQPENKDIGTIAKGLLVDLVGPPKGPYDPLFVRAMETARLNKDRFYGSLLSWASGRVLKTLQKALPSVKGVHDVRYLKKKPYRMEGALEVDSSREFMADINNMLKDRLVELQLFLRSSRSIAPAAKRALQSGPPYSFVGMTSEMLSTLIDFIAQAELSETDFADAFIADWYSLQMPECVELFPASEVGEEIHSKINQLYLWLQVCPGQQAVRAAMDIILNEKGK